MTDTDATIREAATGKAKAIIEFKHANLPMVDLSNWQTMAHRSDAEAFRVPLFVVVYYHLDQFDMPIDSETFLKKAAFNKLDSAEVRDEIKHSQYFCIAGNDLAQTELGTSHRMLSEHDFLALNAKLTGATLRRTGRTSIVPVSVPAIQH